MNAFYQENTTISNSNPSRMSWESFCNKLQNIPHLIERVMLLYSENLNCLQDSIRTQIQPTISSFKELQDEYSSALVYFKKSNTSKSFCPAKAKNVILWIIAAYEAISGKDLKKFLHFDWVMLSTLIPNSDPYQIKYKIYNSLTQINIKAPWSASQTLCLKKALINLYPNIFRTPDSYPTIKWAKVCFELCKQINDFDDFKTDKQCKEMWFNHLNPQIDKSNWSVDDEIVLLEKTLVFGTKWAQISRDSFNRNQHQIKNRFYIVLKRELDIPKAEMRKIIKEERLNSFIVRGLESLSKRSEEEANTNLFQENENNENSFNFLSQPESGFEDFFFSNEINQQPKESPIFNEIEREDEDIFGFNAFKDFE